MCRPTTGRGLFGVATLAVLSALAGCGGGSDNPKPKPNPALRSELGLAGGRIPGTLYLLAGANEFNADVYRATGTLSHVERLTAGARVSWISAQPGAVVSANARGAGSDHVEALDLSRFPALPGRVIDQAGQVPDLSPSRQVAYSVVRYAPDGATRGTLIDVKSLTGGAKRTRYRSREDLSADWLPGGRLAVLSQPDLDHPDRARLVLDAGGSGQRIVDPGIPHATVLLTAPDGTMYVGGGPGRAAIVSADGARHFIDTPWSPRCWAPDGHALLAVQGDRLGLVPATGGAARELGRITRGRVASCSWTSG